MWTVCIGKALDIHNVAALVCATVLISGCNPNSHHGQPEPLGYGTGVRAPNAPNGMLSYWGTESRWYPSARGLDEALTCDAHNAIDLMDVPLTPEIRSRLRQLKDVEWLRLPNDTTAADLEWICELRQLQGISMDNADLTGADFSGLSALDNLKWLNLSYARMSIEDFRTLPPLKELQVLLLEGALVTDEYLFHLADKPQPSLVRLSLPYSKVTDAGVYRLCGVYELEYLGLFCCRQITAKSITPISKMQTLRLLGVGGTAICPDYRRNSRIEELQRRLPHTEVDFGD